MNERKKVTVPDLGRWRESGRRISMITAYDAMFARIVDEAGVDVILVGDSVGMVVQGHSNTIPVDLGEMVYHTRNVARATWPGRARRPSSSEISRSGRTKPAASKPSNRASP